MIYKWEPVKVGITVIHSSNKKLMLFHNLNCELLVLVISLNCTVVIIYSSNCELAIVNYRINTNPKLSIKDNS